MKLTDHEVRELDRLGRAMIARGNFHGATLCGLRADDEMSLPVYDSLMSKYRDWLVFDNV